MEVGIRGDVLLKKVELGYRGIEEREWFLLVRGLQVGSRFGFTSLTLPPA